VVKLRTVLVFCFLLFLTSCAPASKTATLALLGDLALGRGVAPTRDSLAALAPDLQAADLALANLESPLAEAAPAESAAPGYNLCAPAANAQFLPKWGLDLLALANNHRDDCGPDGAAATARSLSAEGLAFVGPGPVPLYRQINGLLIAFMAFDDVLAPLDSEAAAHAIQTAREQGTLVVVLVHWGMEYQGGASDRQKDLARQFAQAGAVLVVGTHPHVLQPVEWVTVGKRKTLVLYSLGNALFDQPGLPDTRQSALVMVQLDAQGVRAARVVPFGINVPASRVESPDARAAQQIRERLGME
jgi:poly-gamma-glutamate capsule biosynthesis protein CapA/YwtB (metallophosphatase superfamily)